MSDELRLLLMSISFWVGVFDRVSEGKLSVCKITFGAEPKDYEIYDFVRLWIRSSITKTILNATYRRPIFIILSMTLSII